MYADWISESEPWLVAKQTFQSGSLGELAEICINEVTDSSRDGWQDGWLDHWLTELKPLGGDPTIVDAHQSARSISALVQYGDGAIARLFADSVPGNQSPWLAFEIIGCKQSMIYRPFGPVQGIIDGADGSQSRVLVDASPRIPADDSAPPLRIGLWSLDHPHAMGNHLPALRHSQSFAVLGAIGDPDRSRCKPLLDEFGCDYEPSLDALLSRNDIDAVLITSRNDHHADDAVTCAKAGRDVLCDKPIAIDPRGVKKIHDAFASGTPRFVTTYPCRFHPAMQALKQAIDRGELGRIESIAATNHGCMYEPGAPDWVKDPKQNGGGCMIDHTVHVADLIRWMTGAEFESVRALASTRLRNMPAEDIAAMHGHMTDGTVFQIDASWSRRGSDPCWGDVTIRVVGDKGSAWLDLYNNQFIQCYTGKGMELRYTDMIVHDHAMIFHDFRQARTEGDSGKNANAKDGLHSLLLAMAAYESVKFADVAPVNTLDWS